MLLYDSENIYQAELTQQCFDVVDVFIMAVNRQGKIILVNKKALDIVGFSAEDLIGNSFFEKIIYRKERKNAESFLEQFFENKNGISHNYSYIISSQEGNRKIINARHVKIRDRSEDITGVLISGSDVTDFLQNQLNLQNDINLYRALVNNIPEINLFLFDRNLRFVIAEGIEMKNSGLSRNLFEGKYLSEVPHPELIKIWKPLFEEALCGDRIHQEYQLDGYHYRIRISPLKNFKDEFFYGIAIIRNITHEKVNAQKLRKSKEMAEQSNKAKNLFLARVSHEIRTPLNAVLGFTEQLLQTDLSAQQRDYVKIIDNSSEHLLSLINDILVLSKIEARQINFEQSPFKLKYIFQYVHSALDVKAREKNLDFSFQIDDELDRVLLGDSFRLQQILMNMVGNAIKFTSRGLVEFRAQKKESKEGSILVYFTVTDTGIGIPPKNLKKIFKIYRQGNPDTSKRYGGTGLGLAICKNLI